MEAIAVSVVIPLYNKEEYIQRCLNSVQQQCMSDYEVLIVDDGSTDGSAEIVKYWLEDKRFRLIQQVNRGEGAARNRGLREAAGPIIAFLDADDEWLPEHLLKVVNLARAFPNAGFFATGYRSVFRSNLNVDGTINKRSSCLIYDYFSFASSGHGVHISATAIRRSIAESGLMFSEDERLGADQEFYIQLVLSTLLAYDPQISSIYHHDVQGNVMASIGWRKGLPFTARRVAELLDADRVPHDLQRSARQYLAWILEQHAFAGIASGNKSEALALLKQLSNLTDEDRNRLDRLRRVLNLVPESVSRLAIRLSRSSWGLIIRSFYQGRADGLGHPRVCQRPNRHCSIRRN